MRISIFNLENKSSYKDEYIKTMKVLNSKCITFNKKNYSYFEYVNTYLFNNWKYRGTYLDCYSYLDFIGVNVNSRKITQDAFINLLEFILNIQFLIENIRYYSEQTTFSVTCKSVLFHNIPLILESFGYKAYELGDRVIVSKFDIDYNDLGELVPDDIYELFLAYNSNNNNGIKMKRIILNKIYNYMCLDIEKYKSYGSSIFNSIKVVITKMGVTGDIDKKYSDLSNYKLRKYYDNCFCMMSYLIRTENIIKARDEIRNENR